MKEEPNKCENGEHPERYIRDCFICGAPNCCLACCEEANFRMGDEYNPL